MFKRKTVFVIGAGGSADFGLPLGSELKTKISDVVGLYYDNKSRNLKKGSSFIFQTIQELSYQNSEQRRTIDLLWEAGSQIKEAMPQALSIDNFLQVHAKNPEIVVMGKLGIAYSILDAERSSKLQFDKSRIENRPNFLTLENTWLSEFVKILLEGIERGDTSTFKNVEIVTFNYDRIIEEYLGYAISNQWLISIDEAREIVNNISIIHVYGSVGLLPWQIGDKAKIKFGAVTSPSNLNQASSTLRTFGESYEKNEIQGEILGSVRKSEQIVFIGFSFMSINMKFFAIPEREKLHAIIATGLGLSKSDRELIETELANLHARPKSKPHWTKEFGLKFEEVKGTSLNRSPIWD